VVSEQPEPMPAASAPSHWRPFQPAGRADGVWSPVADLMETDETYVVEIELPGAKKDDVTIDFHEGELIIAGEIKERERLGVVRWKTRSFGRFDFRVTMPGNVDADNIDAHLAEGVLTVVMLKAERPRPRRIEVTLPPERLERPQKREKRAREQVAQSA